MTISKPKGTQDFLPEQAQFWNRFVELANHTFGLNGYKPVVTPIIEQTTLFSRGIGEETDVVSKEMFNALSDANLATLLNGGHIKAKSRMSLRPEGTAGTVRAIIENGLVSQGSAPVKFIYSGPMFRAERPAAGRYRQFMQVGVECVGSVSPICDAEGIIMLMKFYSALGFGKDYSPVKLVINSMGCKSCRDKYKKALVEFLQDKKDDFCETCQERIVKNPLRVLDCKIDSCQHLVQDAPKIDDFLCGECRTHHNTVKKFLDNANVSYEEDSKLVRGLDYYNRTVFEVKSSKVGAQDALAGGGRYDGLVAQLDGPDVAGFGFAIGYERTLLAMQNEGFNFDRESLSSIFVVCVDKECTDDAFSIAQKLREAGNITEIDYQSRSVKSQFKLANKLNAQYVVVVGPDELKDNKVTVRDMKNHSEEIVLIEHLFNKFKRR